MLQQPGLPQDTQLSKFGLGLDNRGISRCLSCSDSFLWMSSPSRQRRRRPQQRSRQLRLHAERIGSSGTDTDTDPGADTNSNTNTNASTPSHITTTTNGSEHEYEYEHESTTHQASTKNTSTTSQIVAIHIDRDNHNKNTSNNGNGNPNRNRLTRGTTWPNIWTSLARKPGQIEHLDYQGTLLLSTNDNGKENNASISTTTNEHNTNITSTANASNTSNATTSQLLHDTNATNITNDTTMSSGTKTTAPTKNFFSTWSYQPAGPWKNAMSTQVLPIVPTEAAAAPSSPMLQTMDPSISSASLNTPLFANRDPNDVLTVKDVQELMMYMRTTPTTTASSSRNSGGAANKGREGGQTFFLNPLAPIPLSSSKVSLRGDDSMTASSLTYLTPASPRTTASSSTTSAPTTTKSSGVAFPQMSVLTSRDLMIGTTVSSVLVGMLLGISILPNLWFMGGLVVGVWGYQTSYKYTQSLQQLGPQQDEQAELPRHVLSQLILEVGRRVANGYLMVKDAINGLWFMYKTGQLSYTYYKQYSTLDERFALTEKMDAWNARFQEGKRAFDKWEQDNEVGRKLLATLRTVWLVEEKSLKQGRKQRSTSVSKYRIVQYWHDAKEWFQSLAEATWRTVTGGGSSELRNVLKGIRISISQQRLDEVVPRVGAALGAYFVLNLVGALFALLPNVLGLVAIITGLVWPTWVRELRERVSLLLIDLENQGAGNVEMELGKFQFYDTSKYSYFQRADGSKRWYRTGQSMNRRLNSSHQTKKKQNKKKANTFSFLPWDTSNKKRTSRKDDEWWSHWFQSK